MKMFSFVVVVLAAVSIVSTTAFAASDLDVASQAIKSLVPAVENVEGKDCKGRTAARYLTVVHTTTGVSLYFQAYSMVGNGGYADFSIDVDNKNKKIEEYSDDDNGLFIQMSNSNTDMMTRSAQSGNYVLSIKALDANTRRIRIENYNVIYKKNVMECTFRF
jgi:hypothetical protein